MQHLSWPTVLVSAGVSLLVALGTDFFARPRLEARKDRLLELYRARRDLTVDLQRLQIMAAQLVARMPPSFDRAQRDAWTTTKAAKHNRAREITERLDEDLALITARLPAAVRGLCPRYLGVLYGISHAPKADIQVGEELNVAVEPVLNYFGSRGLRRRRHLRAWIADDAQRFPK